MTRSPSSPQSISVQSIQQWLIRHIADSLELDPETLDVEANFTDYGLNSAEMVNISGDLETYLGQPLDPAMVLDYPNISSLASYLAELPTQNPPKLENSKPESLGAQTPEAMLANLDQMSDDEVEGLLDSLLSEKP